MKRANDIAGLALRICGCLALLTLIASLLALAFFTLQLREDIDTLTNNGIGAFEHVSLLVRDADDRVNELKPVVDQANKVLAHAVPVEDAALARVNDLQAPIRSANAMEEAALDRVNELKAPAHQLNELVLDGRRGIDNINKAAIDERFYFETQVPQTMSKLDAAIDGVLPVETNAARTLAETATMASDGEAMTTDVRQAVHSWLHPSWKTRVTNWTVQAGRVVAGFF